MTIRWGIYDKLAAAAPFAGTQLRGNYTLITDDVFSMKL